MLFPIVVFAVIMAGMILVGLHGTSPKKSAPRNPKA